MQVWYNRELQTELRMVFEGVIPPEGSTWAVHFPLRIKFRSAILRSVGVQ